MSSREVSAGRSFGTCEHCARAETSDAAAYGEAVWSWHPLLVSNRRRCCHPNRGRQYRQSGDDGDKRNSSPGRSRRKPFKPSRREGRGCSGEPVVTTVCLLPLHTGCGCTTHPAFPAPSLSRRIEIASLGRIGAARTRMHVQNVARISGAISGTAAVPGYRGASHGATTYLEGSSPRLFRRSSRSGCWYCPR